MPVHKSNQKNPTGRERFEAAASPSPLPPSPTPCSESNKKKPMGRSRAEAVASLSTTSIRAPVAAVRPGAYPIAGFHAHLLGDIDDAGSDGSRPRSSGSDSHNNDTTNNDDMEQQANPMPILEAVPVPDKEPRYAPAKQLPTAEAKRAWSVSRLMMSSVAAVVVVAVITGVVVALVVSPSSSSNSGPDSTTTTTTTDRDTDSTSTQPTTASDPTTASTAAAPCETLFPNTRGRLVQILSNAKGKKVVLCDTTLAFDSYIRLDLYPFIDLECESQCVFDASSSPSQSQRFFNTDPFAKSRELVNYSISFTNIVFQNSASRYEHGGAFVLSGLEGTSNGYFENCVFRNNTAVNGNGGVFEIYRASTIAFVNCTFDDNQAYLGGAISAFDVNITLENTTFRNNQCFGNYEGAAISHGSLTNHLIECIGEDNVFVNNSDPGDAYRAQDVDVVGLTRNCGNVSDWEKST